MILDREIDRQWLDTPIDGIRISVVCNENNDGSHFLQFQKGARFPMHDHDGWEQILMLAGTVKFGNVELSAGDCLVLTAGEQHEALALSDAKFFVAHHGGITIT